jgi:hypothetical protein
MDTRSGSCPSMLQVILKEEVAIMLHCELGTAYPLNTVFSLAAFRQTCCIKDVLAAKGNVQEMFFPATKGVREQFTESGYGPSAAAIAVSRR